MWEHMEDYLSCPTDLQKLTRYYIEEIGGIDGEWKDSKSEVEYFLFENRKGFCVHFASAGTLLFRLAEKRQDMRKDMQFRRVHLKNRKTELIRHRSAERWDMPGVRYGALMTDTGKMLK